MKTEAIPRVGVIDALSSGLVEAARRPWLMILPLLTELVLWFAPHVGVAPLLQRLMGLYEGLVRASLAPGQVPNVDEMLASMREMVAQASSSANLLDAVSGGWLGAPSVLATAQSTRMTYVSDLVLGPAGLPLLLPRLAPAPWQTPPIEINSLGGAMLVGLAFWLVGQVVATVYLRMVAGSWRADAQWAGLRGLARLAVQMVLYSLALGLTLFVLRLPLLFALSLLWLAGGSSLGLLMVLLGGVVLWLTLWFLTSLFFVNEAILLEHQPVWRAGLRSLALVHGNFWSTMGFCLLINLLLYGFRAVWNVVGQHPLGSLVAVVGNAYLVTGILLAVFMFYDNLTKRSVTRRMVGSRS